MISFFAKVIGLFEMILLWLFNWWPCCFRLIQQQLRFCLRIIKRQILRYIQ